MRTYSVKELIQRIRQLTGKERNQAVSDEEIMSFIDHNYPRTWALLAQVSPPDHMVKSCTFNTTPGVLQYDITTVGIVPDLDFWKVKTVYVKESTNELRFLEPVSEYSRLWFRATQATVPIQLDYIMQCPKITSVYQTIDGINGWEDHLVALCCQDVKMKLEEDPSPYIKKEQSLAAEVKKMGYRDAGFAERIVRRKHTDPYFLYRNNVDGYRLKGQYLELYYRSGYRAVP